MTLPERTNSTPKSSACRRKYEYVAVDEDVAEDVTVAVAVAVDVAVAVAVEEIKETYAFARCLSERK